MHIYLAVHGQVNDTVSGISLSYQSVPDFSRNIDRIKLIKHYHFKEAFQINETNSIIKKYCAQKFQTVAGLSISAMHDSLNLSLQSNNGVLLSDYEKQVISNTTHADLIYSLSAEKLFTSESESEMNTVVRDISKELMDMGFNDFENDFMPLLARMLAEHRVIYYQGGRVHARDNESQGIVSAIDIINAHKSSGITAGVCRDVSEFAMRIMRQSFDVYYNESLKRNYNPDDYIFLQAWMTPVSQHVTVLMVDPENPRNGYDLDWGRIYERKDQEGLETPNNHGADTRLWKFDADKNHTVPLMLLKSDKGLWLDKNILSDEEFKSLNSSFYKTFYSEVKIEKSKNDRVYYNASIGKLNDNTYFLLGSISRKARRRTIFKKINYFGKTAIQPYYYENKQVQSELIPWKNWASSHNMALLIRYIAKLETGAIRLNNNTSFRVLSLGQIYFLGSFSRFYTDDNEDNRLYRTADGNICVTYGSEFSFSSNSKKLKIDLLYQRRNFLSPKEVRLLSPNPFVLLGDARFVCSANNIILTASLKLNSTEVRLNTVYEYDILKTQLIQNEFSFSKYDDKKNIYSIGWGFNKQIAGINYYWYPQNKMWIQAACKFSKPELQVNFSIFFNNENVIQPGMSLQKRF